MNGKQAWAVLAAGVVVYNLSAADGSMLSEVVDEWLTTHPVLTRAAILILAAHLANAVPPKYDLVHVGFVGIRTHSRRYRRPVIY